MSIGLQKHKSLVAALSCIVAILAPSVAKAKDVTIPSLSVAMATLRQAQYPDVIHYHFTSKHNNLSVGLKIKPDHTLFAVFARFDGSTSPQQSDVTYYPASEEGLLALPQGGSFEMTPYLLPPILAPKTFCSTAMNDVADAICTIPPASTFDLNSYSIARTENDTLGGESVIHVTLTPVSSQSLAISDLWIDKASGSVVRLSVSGKGVYPSGTGSLTYDFALQQGRPIATRILLAIKKSTGESGSLEYAFSNVAF